MKTKTKALALALCAVLLVVTTVFVTMAYLTSTTDVVKNTFTYGQVTITLDEAEVDEYGKEIIGADRVTENSYKLIPGHKYTKDPTVHIDKASEDCYVFVRVVDEISGIEKDTTVAQQMQTNGWMSLSGVDNVWYYNNKVTSETEDTATRGTTDGVDLLVFGTFTIKDDANVSAYFGKLITVQAYAVQADGFDSAADAWDAAPTEWTEKM